MIWCPSSLPFTKGQQLDNIFHKEETMHHQKIAAGKQVAYSRVIISW